MYRPDERDFVRQSERNTTQSYDEKQADGRQCFPRVSAHETIFHANTAGWKVNIVTRVKVAKQVMTNLRLRRAVNSFALTLSAHASFWQLTAPAKMVD